jgi:hypothetical protein
MDDLQELKDSMKQLSMVFHEETGVMVIFEAKAEQKPVGRVRYDIESTRISPDTCGIFFHALDEINVISFGGVYYYEGDECFIFHPHLSYSHCGGGGNGCTLYSFKNGRPYPMAIVYSKKTKKWVVSK